MELDTINYIKNNTNLYQYLRENSHLYKYLNRDPSSLKEIEETMKKVYKLTPEDRLAKISQSISLVSNFLDVLK